MSLPELSETLCEPDPEEAVALELDELLLFVLKRAKKHWVWIALVPRHPPSGRLCRR